MIIVLITWLYMFILCLLAGSVILAAMYSAASALQDGMPVQQETARKLHLPYSPAAVITAGIVIITVYAEYFSIFHRVDIISHIPFACAALLLALVVAPARRTVAGILKDMIRRLTSAEGLFMISALLAIAFFTSRGRFHTDTGIYHAQAIRLIEEYGVIRGLGNLQLHYAYNSAYLPFCAFFSMPYAPWAGGQALHVTTGFLAAVYSLYAIHGLKDFGRHKEHGADFAKAAILLYVVINAEGLMSPATDYGTLFVTLFLFSAWVETAERNISSEAGIHTDQRALTDFGLLSILALFAASMKLSTAGLVIVMAYPLICWIRRKKGACIGFFLASGFLAFLPYLIRNVILSGWLLYPFVKIDLFDVPWKVPVEHAVVDSDQIKVWGRALYDVALVDMPIQEWSRIWWENQEHYDQMLMYAVVLSALMLALCAVAKKLQGRKLRMEVILLAAAMYLNIAIWFVQAPAIRFGLSSLLTLPLITAGIFAGDNTNKKGYQPVLKAAGTWVAIGIILCYTAIADHYLMTDLVFIKQRLSEPWYISQQPYDRVDEEYEDRDGNRIYYAGYDEINSYYCCPGTCYHFMLERTELMGEDIKDGFAPKYR